LTNFDRNPVFVFQIFQASKDIKRYQKISKVSAQDYFESISSATDSIQKSRLTAIPNKSVAFSAPGLSPVTFRAVQPGCRRQRQAQSSMLFAECVQPPKEKKNTQDSMYFNVFLLCASMCTQNLFTIFAASYGLLWPMHIEFPRQRTDLHLCHKAADALRLLWPITGKHLAH